MMDTSLPHRSLRAAVLPIGLLILLAASDARAQSSREPGKPHASVLLVMGFGGTVEVEATDDDLEATIGLAGSVMYPLHRYFALGGRLTFVSWQSETGDAGDWDRSSIVDLAVVPAATFRVDDAVELYLGLALGPSIDVFGPNEELDNLFGGAVEVDPALGFAVTPLFGARFWLGNSVGLTAELGLALHSYEHDVNVQPSAVVPLPLPGASASFDLDVTQPNLDVGVFFDF